MISCRSYTWKTTLCTTFHHCGDRNLQINLHNWPWINNICSKIHLVSALELLTVLHNLPLQTEFCISQEMSIFLHTLKTSCLYWCKGAEEHHVMQPKAPEQLLNRHWGEIKMSPWYEILSEMDFCWSFTRNILLA